MKIIATLLIFGVTLSISSSAAGRIVCSMFTWTIYRPGDGKFSTEHVHPNLCTHLLYGYFGLNEDGSFKILDSSVIIDLNELEHLMALKEQNPALKVVLWLGGYSQGSEIFSEVAANATKRSTMIKTTIDYMRQSGFDGLDLDWEYPGQSGGDQENDSTYLITWMSELKEALHAQNYSFSITTHAMSLQLDLSYKDGKAISDNVDFINIRSFDYHGAWDNHTGHVAPLYASSLDVDLWAQTQNVVISIESWIRFGADPQKMNIGIITFGRSFTLRNSSDNSLYAPIYGPGEQGPYTKLEGLLGFNEICALYDDWEEIWDNEQQVPHRIYDDQWVGFESPESVQLKIQFANKMGLGGAMIYSLDTDDFLGKCGEKYPLLRTIDRNIN